MSILRPAIEPDRSSTSATSTAGRSARRSRAGAVTATVRYRTDAEPAGTSARSVWMFIGEPPEQGSHGGVTGEDIAESGFGCGVLPFAPDRILLILGIRREPSAC